MLDFSHFKDFYLIKCFGSEAHRGDFNSGKKMYLNSLKYFHKCENLFQGDLEGLVLQQEEKSTSKLILSRGNVTLDELACMYKEDCYRDGIKVFPVQDFKFYFDGYLCCFAVIPKSWMRFEEKNVVYNEYANAYEWLITFLNMYCQGKYCYFSVYDAEDCLQTLYHGLTGKGFSVAMGTVAYREMDAMERIRAAQNGDISSIIFTKNKSFEYQREFRVFITHKTVATQEHIEIQGISLEPSVVTSLAYISPEYLNELQAKENEI